MEIKTSVREDGLISVVTPGDDRKCYHLAVFLQGFGRTGFCQDFHYLHWKQMEGDAELVAAFDSVWKAAQKPFEV